jgi:ribosomal protein L11
MKVYKFKGVLESQPGKWGFSYVEVPWSVEEEFGTKASIRIKGTVNGIPMDRALKPKGDGTHYIMINTELQRKAGLRKGSEAAISFTVNEKPDELEIPEELEAGFEMEPGSKELFDAHVPSVRRNVVYWIATAKTPETRAKRAAEMLRRIVTGTLTAPKKRDKEHE